VAFFVAGAAARAAGTPGRDLLPVPGAHAHLRDEVPRDVSARGGDTPSCAGCTEDDASPRGKCCDATGDNTGPHGNICASSPGIAPPAPERPTGAEMGGRSPGVLVISASDAQAWATAAEAAAGVQRDNGSREHVRPGSAEACVAGAR
jgi:hypothetical protein